ncbi:DNA helicase IV [Vibrio sp.]|nr:DNA helicase IV [Vibrio sp.]
MILKASKTAAYFAQNEFHSIEVIGNMIKLSARFSEVILPFSKWNGKVEVRHGLIWSTIRFHGYPNDKKLTLWEVKGLSEAGCAPFCEVLIERYQEWHQEQAEMLLKHYMKWEENFHALVDYRCYIDDRCISTLIGSLDTVLNDLELTRSDLINRLPNLPEDIKSWLSSPHETLQTHNEAWLKSKKEHYKAFFHSIETSPLNDTQQTAVLLNNNANLILAGAGSGKTSVLATRVAHLIQHEQVTPDSILLLAYGRDAATEMRERLAKLNIEGASRVQIYTFHQLGLNILKSGDKNPIKLSELATNKESRHLWLSQWLTTHWDNKSYRSRWLKHFSSWSIAYLKGDVDLLAQTENAKLIDWLDKQLLVLSQLGLTQKQLEDTLNANESYSAEEIDRFISELKLVYPCYKAWKKELKEQGEIDFITMVTKATKEVTKGRYCSKWTHILVDEYQDISEERLDLVQALYEQSLDNRLFAVGDDWQAIYQFAGAKLRLTTHFSERFPFSSVTSLDTTYRFNNKIGEVANAFIQKNPNQLNKTLMSFKQQKPKSVVLCSIKLLEKTLNDLNQDPESVGKQVLLLGRNHFHRPEHLDHWKTIFPNINMSFMTCHASKGKEADYVFIVNVDEGQFPTKRRLVHLDSVLMTDNNEAYPDADERRLFYVALTRAKEKAWVMYNGGGSAFVQELLEGDYPIINKR